MRRLLTGVAVGLVVGGGLAALFWWLRLGELRPWAAAVGVLGGGLGLALGWRRRWTDEDVALYLDARLEGHEAISTALELSDDSSEPARAVVLDRAQALLAGGAPRAARPRVLRRLHAVALIGAGGVLAASLAPLPPEPPPPAAPPGAEIVQDANLAGLEKIIALEKLEAVDAEQRARLDAIAREAKQLRADLAKGLEKREALARIAKLEDEIAKERTRFGDQANRAGLAAAIRKLEAHTAAKDAAEALGEGDLTEFDREMQKLASQAEAEARDAAKEALKDAAKAARERGAQELAEMLERELKQFERQEAEAEALRELGKQLEGKLSDQARRDLEEFGATGDPEAQRRLAEALEEALDGLTEEERQRLAERLQEKLEADAVSPLTREQLEELAKKLESEAGRKELEEMLKDLARQQPSADAERQQGLDDAERGGAEAQRRLGLVPLPQRGGAQPGGERQPGAKGDRGDQDGAGGPGEGGGEGEHGGKTERTEGDKLRAKADVALDPSVPLKSGTLGRAPGGKGDTANQQGTGVLGEVGDAEMEAVERSDVPEEYREQVGRYFQP